MSLTLSFEVPEGTEKFVYNVIEKTIDEESKMISELTEDDLQKLVAKKIISEDIRQAIQKVLGLKRDVNSVARSIIEKESDIRACKDNQERLRKNIAALGMVVIEQTKYIKELSSEEDLLKKLYEEVRKLRLEKQNLEKEANALAFDIEYAKEIHKEE